MYKCNICEKEFESRFCFLGHCSVHVRKSRKSKNIKSEKHKCKFCEKEFETGQKLGSHTRLCKLNPLFQERIKKSMDKNKITKNKSWQKENGKRISESVMKKVINGTWHTSFKRTRIFEYNGVKLHGTWELEYAKWLDENNIKWKRPSEKFPYYFDGKNRHYTPDFYLIDTKEYIEIKGYETDKDKAKWNQFPEKLIILKSKELKKLKLKLNY